MSCFLRSNSNQNQSKSIKINQNNLKQEEVCSTISLK